MKRNTRNPENTNNTKRARRQRSTSNSGRGAKDPAPRNDSTTDQFEPLTPPATNDLELADLMDTTDAQKALESVISDIAQRAGITLRQLKLVLAFSRLAVFPINGHLVRALDFPLWVQQLVARMELRRNAPIEIDADLWSWWTKRCKSQGKDPEASLSELVILRSKQATETWK